MSRPSLNATGTLSPTQNPHTAATIKRVAAPHHSAEHNLVGFSSSKRWNGKRIADSSVSRCVKRFDMLSVGLPAVWTTVISLRGYDVSKSRASTASASASAWRLALSI